MTYTTKEVEKLHEVYGNNPILETVDRLSVLLNKPRKSIIAKLVKEGIYQRRGYRTKGGAVPITKIALVRKLEASLGIKLLDLEKAPKGTLQLLVDHVCDMADTLEDLMGDISLATEVSRVRSEIEELTK